jgi:ubiquinol-cytochrome c reductase cytochrome c1 subunit
MRTKMVGGMRTAAVLVLMAFTSSAFAAEEVAGEVEGKSPTDAGWEEWRAENQVENLGSLQRGARNFISYCSGCHSLKYVRYSRMAQDLSISDELLQKYLLPANTKPTDYMLTSMPIADAEAWFGKAPPDLSLIARSRGSDYVYQFLKTFYADPTKPTGANNLRLEGTAMPHVLSELEGLKKAVFKTEEEKGENGEVVAKQVFDHFEELTPGRLTQDEYDVFVRDIVNFLDYAGEPTQVARKSLGIWVVLFLLVFTWLAWLLKKEYWKDVH